MSRLLAEAYAFAAETHATQVLKGARPDPYILHLCRVAALAASESAEEAIIAAAVLHDSVEDTPTTLDALIERFGAEIATTVGWLTDDPAIEKLPTDLRKARQAEKMARAPEAARLIKIADQLDNLRGRLEAFEAWPAERHRLYLAGARQVVAACGDAAPALKRAFDDAADALAARIERASEGTNG